MERAAELSAGAHRWHAGSCHCGRVRIEALAPADLALLECNCSMCARSGYLHLIVQAHEFRLVAGAEALVEYTFGTGLARHRFCRHCGVKSFYQPRSHQDSWSVNAHCLDEPVELAIEPFDGANWEAAAEKLK